MRESTSDEQLVCLVRAGDEAALDALYTRFGHLAYRLAFHLVQDGPEAETIVVSAFWDLWHGGDGGTTLADVRAELLRSIRRHASDRGHELEPDRGELRQVAADRDREALELAYFGCYTRHEVSRILRVSLEEATARIANGLRGLASLCEETPTRGVSHVSTAPQR